MLFFLDDTTQTILGRQAVAVGVIALPVNEYNHFCRAIYRIKQRELGAQELTQKELKGTSNFAKAAFKRQEMEGSSPYLSAVEQTVDILREHGGVAMSVSNFDSTLLRTQRDLMFPSPYIELVNRMLRYAKSADAAGEWDGVSSVYFDQVGHREDERVGSAFQNYFTRSWQNYQLRKYFLQVPHFTHSSLSPGIQAADLLAYLACQQLGPTQRPELQPFWEQFMSMQFHYYDSEGKKVSSCSTLDLPQPTLDNMPETEK